MNLPCFTLLLSALSSTATLPPKHIQDLLKKRLLFQVKEQSSELPLFFDEPKCTTLATYEYQDQVLHIESSDKSIDQSYLYSDLIEGKKIAVSPLLDSIENKKAYLALSTTHSISPQLPALEKQNGEETRTPSNSKIKKYLPYILGAAGLIGGLVIYQSLKPTHSEDSSKFQSRRYR